MRNSIKKECIISRRTCNVLFDLPQRIYIMETHFTILRKLKTVILAAALLFPALLSAQDYIYTVDTSPIAAKVSEIGEDYVIYKTFDNLNGPNYRLATWKILKIVFENGTQKTFAQTGPYLSNPGGYPYPPMPHYDNHCIEYHHGHYYCRHERLRGNEIADYIGYSLYGTEYMSAKRKYSWGIILTCLGAGSLVMGVSIHSCAASFYKFEKSNIPSFPGIPDREIPNDNIEYIGAAACYIAGAGCLGAGIPLLVKGQRGLRKIADDYNRNYRPDSREYSLNLGTTRNGVGLSLNF